MRKTVRHEPQLLKQEINGKNNLKGQLAHINFELPQLREPLSD